MATAPTIPGLPTVPIPPAIRAPSGGSTSGGKATRPRKDPSAYEDRLLSASEIVAVCQQAGFRGNALIQAVARAGAESSWQTGRVNVLAPGDDYFMSGAYGLFQIRPAYKDQGTGRPRDNFELLDPEFNAKAAYTLSKGGTNWGPWKSSDKLMKNWLGRARDAVAKAGLSPVEGATTSPDATSNGVPTVDPFWADGKIYPLRIAGLAGAGELGTRMTAGSVDLSTKQASEVEITLQDENLTLLRENRVGHGTRIDLNHDIFTVTDVSLAKQQAGAAVTLRAQSAAIVALMHTDPPAANNITRHDYVKLLCRAAGVTFVPSLDYKNGLIGTRDPKAAITPNELKLSDGTDPSEFIRALNPYAPKPEKGSRRENGWEVIQRLAQEIGYTVYVDKGRLYFRQSDILVGTKSYISWPGQLDTSPPGALRALDVPSITLASRQTTGRYAHVNVSFTLAPEQRYALSLGQDLDMAISPLLHRVQYYSGGKVFDQRIRVTRISWDLGDMTGVVTVQAETVVRLEGTLQDAAGTTAADDGHADETNGTSSAAVGSTRSSTTNSADGAGLGWQWAGPTVTQTVPGTSVRLTVARDAGPILFAFAAEFNSRVEKLIPAICGGYYPRNIRGSSKRSNHGYGIAIDLNSTRHELARRGTFSAAQVKVINELCDKYQLYWGGNWRGRADEMHFELGIGPSAARRYQP